MNSRTIRLLIPGTPARNSSPVAVLRFNLMSGDTAGASVGWAGMSVGCGIAVAGVLAMGVSATTGALVAGIAVVAAAVGTETVVGGAAGDPQAANSRPLISKINVTEVFVLVNISLPF
jgi:hypothetical protein